MTELKIIKFSDFNTYKGKEYFKKLFPKKKHNQPINYNNLLITNISIYSMTKNNISSLIMYNIDNFVDKYFNLNCTKLIITDALSNCGGMTLEFAKYFKTVNAIEIIKLQSNILLNNIKEYNYKNINVYNNDYIDIYMKIEQDIIYFDPPWNDIDYKNMKNIDLFINNNNILNIINLLLTKKKTKLCILYTPENYNFKNIKNIILNNEIYIKKIINKYIIFFF
jgi:hypothetical protein